MFIRLKENKYLNLFFILSSCFFIFRYLIYITNSIIFRYHLNLVESYILEQVRIFPNLIKLYPNESALVTNWLPSAYPPIYVALLSIFYNFFGPAYWYGRLISFLSVLGIYFLISKIVLQKKYHIYLSLFLISITLANPFFINWSILARPDYLASFFYWLVIYLVLFESKFSLKKNLLILGFSLLTIFTKQTYLPILLLTVSSFLILENKIKLLIIYIISLFTGFFLITFIFNFFTHGGYWFNIVSINASIAKDLSNFFSFFINFFSFNFFFLIFIIFSFSSFYFKTKFLKKISFIVFASFLPILMSVHMGADFNYFFEFMVAFSLFSVVVVNENLVKNNSSKIKFLFLVIFLQVIIFFRPSIFYGIEYLEYCNLNTRVYLRKVKDPLLATLEKVIVSERSTRVLADRAAIGILPLVGKPVEIDFFAVSRLYFKGIGWDRDILAESIKNKDFDLIILEPVPPQPDIKNLNFEKEYWFTPREYEAISENYYLFRKIFTFYIFKPKE